MKVGFIKLNGRLIRNAEFMNGFETNNTPYGMLSIFKNPTDKEIEEAKKESMYDAIRGLICNDGTIYCWAGSVLHDKLPLDCKLPINDSFRFAYENNEWIFDLHEKLTFKEGFEKFCDYRDILSKFGNTNDFMGFYFASDDGESYDKYGLDNVFGISKQTISFENGDKVDIFIDDIDIWEYENEQ